MRGFLVLCLAAAANANQLGYNYQQLGRNVEIVGGLPGGDIDSGSSAGLIEVGSGAGNGGGIVASADTGFGGFAGTNDINGNYATNGISSSSNNNNNNNNNNGGLVFDTIVPAAAAEFNKEFYTYAAPAEEFNDHVGAQRIASTLKKNLRVVFIRAPENQGLANAALQLAKQSTEDRTAIYVLNKQSDIGDLANQLQTLKASSRNRPEVHFVKYRTAEDAARAQRTIQAQYEALGGQSHNSDEGVAPVLNFASPQALTSSAAATGFSGAQSAGGASTLAGSGFGVSKHGYLPPALRLK